MVTEALSRHGIAGVVVRKGSGLELFGKDGAPIWVDATQDLEQWSLLPQNLRERKAQALAARIAHLYRERGGSTPTGTGMPPMQRFVTLGVGLAIGLTLILGMRAYRASQRAKAAPASSATPGESPEHRRERLSRACEATRKAMREGGPWFSMPLEGWTVELWLGRREGGPLAEDPALRGTVTGDKLTKNADAVLADVLDGSAAIEAGPGGDRARPTTGLSEARLVLGDGYGREFFTEKRGAFVSLGQRLAHDTKADFAALYARCAHLPTHDAGAWVWGRDAGKAAAALVYEMGVFASVPVVDRAALTRLPGSGDLDALAGAGAGLDSGALTSLVSSDGGRVVADDGVSVAFTYNDPTRATLASRAVARKLGVGTSN
jgi:serine/threonine-protein kinase